MTNLLDRNDSANIASVIMEIETERRDMNKVSMLPVKIYPDGNQWCVLWGENIQEGVGGFGDTPILAIMDFNRNIYTQKVSPKQ